MVRELRQELSNSANEFNTPGPVNVALFFEERLLPGGFAKDFDRELEKLANDTLIALEKFYIACDKAEWSNNQSKEEHLTAIKRLVNSMKTYIANSTVLDDNSN